MKTVEDVLAHVGILGMRWGVRSSGGGKSKASSSAKKPSADNDGPSEEHMSARIGASKSVKNLSNVEIKKINERLQLEQSFKNLTPSKYKRSMDFIKTVTAAGATLAALYALSETPLGQAVKSKLVKKVVAK